MKTYKSLKLQKAIAFILIIMLIALSGCSPKEPEPVAQTQIITDMAGRQVEISAKVEKVYSTSAIGSVLLYTLAPEKLAGWNSELREDEKKFIEAKYHNLPNLGRWKGTKSTGGIEDLLKASPDIMISVGDITPSYAADADVIQKQTGIPVIMLDGSLHHTAETYTRLGEIIGETQRAGELAAYCQKTLDEINSNLKSLPTEEKVKVYYGQGLEGLETELSGTVNTEAFDMAGAYNVAVPVTQDTRRMQVSVEEILTWNPELIIVSTDGDTKHILYDKILTNNAWSNIKAVKNKEVYEIPNAPYDWLNRPPSITRFIGVKWLSSLLYPDLVNIDIKKEMKEFYTLFFDYNISEEEIQDLLSTATRK